MPFDVYNLFEYSIVQTASVKKACLSLRLRKNDYNWNFGIIQEKSANLRHM